MVTSASLFTILRASNGVSPGTYRRVLPPPILVLQIQLLIFLNSASTSATRRKSASDTITAFKYIRKCSSNKASAPVCNRAARPSLPRTRSWFRASPIPGRRIRSHRRERLNLRSGNLGSVVFWSGVPASSSSRKLKDCFNYRDPRRCSWGIRQGHPAGASNCRLGR